MAAWSNPGAIKRTALLTIEGERDDICGLGQTLAAQDLCTGLRQYMKMHRVQTGVGHYGVFSGRRWNNEVYPNGARYHSDDELRPARKAPDSRKRRWRARLRRELAVCRVHGDRGGYR